MASRGDWIVPDHPRGDQPAGNRQHDVQQAQAHEPRRAVAGDVKAEEFQQIQRDEHPEGGRDFRRHAPQRHEQRATLLTTAQRVDVDHIRRHR